MRYGWRRYDCWWRRGGHRRHGEQPGRRRETGIAPIDQLHAVVMILHDRGTTVHSVGAVDVGYAIELIGKHTKQRLPAINRGHQ